PPTPAIVAGQSRLPRAGMAAASGSGPVLRLVLRRLIQAVPVILAILCLNFALLKAAPGDAVDALLLETGGADAETQARLRAEWELDLSWPVQLGLYLGRVATLDLGRSVAFARPVLDVILERLPNTLLL